MSFGMLFGRPKISLRSLEDEFHPIDAKDSPSVNNKGFFNAGVFVVRRKPDDRRCVEKRFREKDIGNGRAEFEMFALRELAHKNIIEYLHGFIDFGSSRPRASMYMELADLGTLDHMLEKRHQDLDWFRESELWDLSMQLANAVAYLQYGIRDASSTDKFESRVQPGWIGLVHRDIKPSNIFLRSDFGSQFPRVVLGDFGQAIREDNKNWARDFLQGDRRWRPPESPPYHYASDVWAVGASIQATCHLGKFFVKGRSQEAVGAGHRYSDCLSDAILQSMHADPRRRVRIGYFARYLGIKAVEVFEYERSGGLEPNGHCQCHSHPVSMI